VRPCQEKSHAFPRVAPGLALAQNATGMKNQCRSSGWLYLGVLWPIAMLVGCDRSSLVSGVRKDAGIDVSASSADAKETGAPSATGGNAGSSAGGGTTTQGGQGGRGVTSSAGGVAGHDASMASDVADAGNRGGSGGSGGAGGSHAGGVTGFGGSNTGGSTSSSGGTGRDAGLDAHDGNVGAKESGPARFDQQPGVDGSGPISCSGMLMFGGFLPLADTGDFDSRPNFVALGDLNGDHVLDVVASNEYGTVVVALGNGDGTLGSATSYKVSPIISIDGGQYLASIALGDVNGDGSLDIVTANFATGTVSVFLGKGDGTFSDDVDYSVESSATSKTAASDPSFVALGDFNGDGHLDIATANGGSSSAAVLLGKGDGTFATAVTFPTGGSPSSLALGDVNHDGKLDLVAATSAGLTVMLGNGDGTLNAGVDLSIGSPITSAALADMNGDGKLDLVVGAAQQIAVLLGGGDGTFAKPSSYPTAWWSPELALGDLNGDGKPDIVAWVSAAFSILIGHGDGTFAPETDFPAPEPLAWAALGDMNRDGKLDIVLAWSPEPAGTVDVLLGQGDGTFAQTAYAVGHDTADIDVGDLDGDGRLDVATVGKPRDGVGAVSLLFGKADGTLAAPTDYSLPGNPSLVRLADVNGDGRLDVVTVSSDVTTVTVLLGGGALRTVQTDAKTQPTAMALGDVNGDGKLDLALAHADANSGEGSVAILLGRGDGSFAPTNVVSVCDGPASVALGDFDGDSRLDLAVACDLYASGSGNTVGLHVLLGLGDGTFTPRGDYLGTGYGVSSVALGDLNKDGQLDIVTVEAFAISGVNVLLGKGDGSFADPVEYATPWGAHRIALVDINRDGNLDVVTQDDYTGGWGGSAITLLLGNGDGTLAPKLDYPVDAQGLAFGDMNGDGRLDLVAATYSNSVSVFFGSCR